ncbi:MAG: winged helix-turn-helix transcriptional regulator [Candidatus Methanomethylophilaceae archaeon]|jgi:predicted transcriptional regulator
MTKKIPIRKIAILLIVIYAILLGLVYHYAWPWHSGDISNGKQVGDVYIEPAYGMDTSDMTLAETHVAAPEELSFNTRMMIFAFALSPFVLGIYQILLAVNIVPVLRFKSVNKDNVLRNNKRKEIWLVVKEYPGMSFNELREMTSHIKGNFRYHLEMLVRCEYLKKYQINGFIGYFDAGGSVTDSEKYIIIALKSKTAKEIYSILQKNKGISRKELSELLHISGPTVTWHMKRLISLGIVRATYSGNSVSYCLASHSDAQKHYLKCDP